MKAKLIFEPRDLWVGLFWKRDRAGQLNLFFSAFPTLVLHVVLARKAGVR
jgi:hypothetical protein